MLGNKLIKKTPALFSDKPWGNFIAHAIFVVIVSTLLTLLISNVITSYGKSKTYHNLFSDSEAYSLQNQLLKESLNTKRSERTAFIGSKEYIKNLRSNPLTQKCSQLVLISIPDYSLPHLEKINSTKSSFYGMKFNAIFYENRADLWTALSTERPRSVKNLWTYHNRKASFWDKQHINLFFTYLKASTAVLAGENFSVNSKFDRKKTIYPFEPTKLENHLNENKSGFILNSTVDLPYMNPDDISLFTSSINSKAVSLNSILEKIGCSHVF